jgi:CheY-like chemotaxis protein
MVELNDESHLLSRVRVLVVEDDGMVRSILVEYLESWGFKHIEAANHSRHAAKLLADEKEPFDLVLSDWQMPDIDGLELLRMVRRIPFRKDTKFIMITSQVPEERVKVAKAIEAGVDAYVVKPFKGEFLRQKIWLVLGWDKASGGGSDAA